MNLKRFANRIYFPPFRLQTGGVVILPFLLFAGPAAAFAQAVKSPVFPPDRHRELMEEIVFEPKEKEEEEPEEVVEEWDFNWDFDLSDTTTLIIFLLLVAALGFLVYRMLGDVDLRKRTRGEGDDDGQDFIRLEDIEEDRLVVEGVSLSLLERAENAGQFDVAVRLLYIQLLKELQDAGLIRYRRDYSNRDYQVQLSGSGILSDFQDLTVDYERYWYGKYSIEKLGYRLVQRKFNALRGVIGQRHPKANADA